MRKKGNDLERESNNLSIIVVLALFLICSLGYIGYDKYYADTDVGSVDVRQVEKSKAKGISYNKDGIFIKSLMKKIILHTGIDHSENQLYEKDRVTLSDLSDVYKNSLIINNIHNTSFSPAELEESSIEIFGKNIYNPEPQTIDVTCASYTRGDNDIYSYTQGGGCGGAGYRYYELIDSVDSDEDHIYVYQRVAFSCEEGVCNNLEKTSTGYKGTGVVQKLDNPYDKVYLNEIKNDLPLYKFTFKYHENHNIYYFESVEKEN